MQRLLATLVLSLVLGLTVAAQVARAPAQGPQLERWMEHSPEERERLRARFEAFQRMDPEKQAELRARFERLREAEARVRRDLEPEQLARLEELSPRERREFLREHLEHEFSRCGRRVEGLLPPELRERLESAAPTERMELMTDFRARCEGEKLARGLREVGERLGLAEGELAMLDALDPEAQRARLLELRRRELVERVAREGLPTWIAAEQWQEWGSLEDREFWRRLHARRGSERGEDGRSREPWRLLRPDPDWLDELSDLEPEARRAELERRMAARFLEYGAEHPERMAAGELERLRGLPPSEVMEVLRARLRAGRGERGDGGEPGERRGSWRERGGDGAPDRDR